MEHPAGSNHHPDVPDLAWLRGVGVRISAEEQAPLVRLVNGNLARREELRSRSVETAQGDAADGRDLRPS